MKLKWWLTKKKEILVEEQSFKIKQYHYTEELFRKALERFELNPKSEMIYFDPFESMETRKYIAELCCNNLISNEYIKELCDKFDLKFSTNVEVEGDYPTLYFTKEVKKTLQK